MATADQLDSVWRPLKRVECWPLALCDARSVPESDLATCDVIRRHHVGETWYSTFNPGHEWYFLSNQEPDQEPDEVTLIKVYDPKEDVEAKCQYGYPRH